MMCRHLLYSIAAAGLFVLVSESITLSADPPAKRAAAATDIDPQVALLVEQLGADDFAVRQRAQTQLSRMGLEAFDALVAAQYAPGMMEVQMRARFLVRGMNVRWYDESDPPEVARLLKSFGEQSDDERKSRIDRLGNMADLPSLTALCRLARYEVNPILSKHAALLILHRLEPKTPELREQTAATITQGIAASKRPAAGWLHLYCRTLREPAATVDEWQAVIEREREMLALQPLLTNRQVVRDLYRWQIELLKPLQRDAEVIALMKQTIELLDNDPAQVTEIVDWLVHRKAWQVVLDVGNRFPQYVSEDHALMYLRAHAHLALKQPEPAKELAAAALKLRSANVEEHLLVAAKLADKWGLFDFSEQEYRELMRTAPGSFADFKARFQLSEQLHDQGRELAAAECLQPAIDLMFPAGDDAKGEIARETARRASRIPEGARSRMHYFYSRHHNEQKDYQKEKESLSQAIASDPTDADVLIARFRLPNLNAAERLEANEQVDATAEKFKALVVQSREEAEEAADEQDRASYNFNLAIACNQFAWLVSNTRGDFDEALKCSQRSVELRPEEGGYWDTLGRCHYAKGDFVNAVKDQSHAVKLQPHSGQIRKQLAFFEKALADKQAAKP